MNGVTQIKVTLSEDGIRLDRWFKRHHPGLGHGKLQKLLRTGQIRIDGGRAKADVRLATGQAIRVPPLGEWAEKDEKARPPAISKTSKAEARDLAARILHRDEDLLVLNKPAGLATQGGTGTRKHIDGMLDALRFGAKERPRLVHRLDKGTSGALILGRNAAAAAKLTSAFRTRDMRKLYWALVVGVPDPQEGRISLGLSKRPGQGGEKMVVDEKEGQKAVTFYRTIDKAGRRAAWVSMEPQTGRTHQLRVHMAWLGVPVQGDGKYGGREAFLDADGVTKGLHLHARAIRLPHPAGGVLDVTAPLPEHMLKSWQFFGFDKADPEAGFRDD